MPESTLTTQRPNEPPQTRPVPPSWATVAPLLARWHLALLPNVDGSWDIIEGFSQGRPTAPRRAARGSFHELPQAIAELAAQCDAAAKREEEER